MRPRLRTSEGRPPAHYFEELVESVLGQTLYAIEFAWRFTALETHLREWLSATCRDVGGNPQPADHQAVIRRLVLGVQALLEAADHVRTFCNDLNLGALDRGLGLARSVQFSLDEAGTMAGQLGGRPAERALSLLFSPPDGRDWEQDWQARVHRHHGESRVCFACRRCGWEFAYVAEVGSAQELELPFDALECPMCEPEGGRQT